MIKSATTPKSRKSLIVSAIAAVGILGSLMAIPAYAEYSYTPEFYDQIESKTTQGFDLNNHVYSGNDIGANNIRVTAPSRVNYLLELYVRNFWGVYPKYGPSVNCDTDNLGGYYWWEGVSSDGGSNTAHLRIWRHEGTDGTALGGGVYSQGRTWH